MTEIQLANYVCDELRREMPFDLIFNQDELPLFMEIINASKLNVGFPVKNIGDNTHIGVTKENLNGLYEVFSNYIKEQLVKFLNVRRGEDANRSKNPSN